VSDMYGFGVDDPAGEPAQDPQGPKWFREYMDKVSGQLKSLQERNEELERAQRQTQVAEALKAKGYAPQAAGLYSGDPNKLDDWLSANGAALARTEAAPEGDQQGQPAGPPPTVVSPESQAAMAAMSAASTGGAGPLSGEDQLAARLEAAGDDEAAFNAIMREAGNVRFR